MITLEEVITLSRYREYMSGIERDKARIKATSEVFTPWELAEKLIKDNVSDDNVQDDFLDPSCGDGQILSEILIWKMQVGHMSHEEALKTIYGVDIMPDNVEECQDRLLCGQEHLRHIVKKNIVCENALTYDYKFKKPPTTTLKQKKTEANQKRLKKIGIIIE